MYTAFEVLRAYLVGALAGALACVVMVKALRHRARQQQISRGHLGPRISRRPFDDDAMWARRVRLEVLDPMMRRGFREVYLEQYCELHDLPYSESKGVQ